MTTPWPASFLMSSFSLPREWLGNRGVGQQEATQPTLAMSKAQNHMIAFISASEMFCGDVEGSEHPRLLT